MAAIDLTDAELATAATARPRAARMAHHECGRARKLDEQRGEALRRGDQRVTG
jgi:hypothetical protein